MLLRASSGERDFPWRDLRETCLLKNHLCEKHSGLLIPFAFWCFSSSFGFSLNFWGLIVSIRFLWCFFGLSNIAAWLWHTQHGLSRSSATWAFCRWRFLLRSSDQWISVCWFFSQSDLVDLTKHQSLPLKTSKKCLFFRLYTDYRFRFAWARRIWHQHKTRQHQATPCLHGIAQIFCRQFGLQALIAFILFTKNAPGDGRGSSCPVKKENCFMPKQSGGFICWRFFG